MLTAAQARVLGALVEKEVTTPDYYPLSLNALMNACNQRSNREPVMNLDEDDVRQALHGLEDKGLAGRARGADEVLAGLQKLMEREPALAAVLPRQPGMKEARYAHLLSGPVESIVFAEPAATHESAANSSGMQERMERMEQAMEELRQQVATLSAKIDNLFG